MLLAARRERARAVMDVAECLGIEKVGGTRETFEKAMKPPAWRRARRSRAPPRAAVARRMWIAEVGRADVAHDDPCHPP